MGMESTATHGPAPLHQSWWELIYSGRGWKGSYMTLSVPLGCPTQTPIDLSYRIRVEAGVCVGRHHVTSGPPAARVSWRPTQTPASVMGTYTNSRLPPYPAAEAGV